MQKKIFLNCCKIHVKKYHKIIFAKKKLCLPLSPERGRQTNRARSIRPESWRRKRKAESIWRLCIYYVLLLVSGIVSEEVVYVVLTTYATLFYVPLFSTCQEEEGKKLLRNINVKIMTKICAKFFF